MNAGSAILAALLCVLWAAPAQSDVVCVVSLQGDVIYAAPPQADMIYAASGATTVRTAIAAEHGSAADVFVHLGDAFGPGEAGCDGAIRALDPIPFSLAVPGCREFGNGIDAFLARRGEVRAEYLSANFKSVKTRNIVMPAFAFREFGGRKIAFVGVTMPQECPDILDAAGTPRYTFSADDLAGAVQSAVDAARAKGADAVVLLAHLGDEGPFGLGQVIAGVRGIDAVLDGHSSVDAIKHHLDADGKSVLCISLPAGALGGLIIGEDSHAAAIFTQ